MSDSGYTPTTAEIESAVGDWALNEGHPDRGDRSELLVDDGETLFARFLAAHDAVIREDERKLQAEKDAVIAGGFEPKVHVRHVGWTALRRDVAKAIRGQSFTGTEKQ